MTALKRIIVVLGPHRSGTSAITKGLEVVGASLGSRLMAADSHNEKGYWEDLNFYALNQEMLASTGRDWHHLSLPDESEFALLRERYFERAARLVAERTEASDLIGLKDPRFCLLLPFWSEVFAGCGVEASYVLALRHPASVGASLLARDSLPKEKPDWIWVLHMLGALAGTANSPRIIVDYEELLRNPAEQIGRLASALRLGFRENQLHAFQESFLDASLNHHASGGRLVASVPLAMEIHEHLHRIATDSASFAGPHYEAALAKWLGNQASAQSLLALSHANDVAIDELGALAAERTRTIAELQTALSGHEQQIGLLGAEKDRLNRELKESLSKQQYAFGCLQEKSSELQRALASVEAWQRSWFRRAFTRWRMLEADWRPGFFRRLERSVRKRRRRLMSAFGFREVEKPAHPAGEDDYQQWIQSYDTLEGTTRAAMKERIAGLENPPLISVVMPTFNPEAGWLEQAVASVERQLYPHWELCIADDASSKPHVRRMLEEFQRRDPRIRVVYRATTGHISLASNSAIELARGDYVAFLDHDDVLAEHALFFVAMAAVENPDARVIYSDEDKLTADGRRVEPHFKSDWNPDLFYSQNYVCHLAVYRRDLLVKAGGFRPGVEGSQDHDLLLRCLSHIPSGGIVHIPRILYHWRIVEGSTALHAAGKSYTTQAGVKALRDHFEVVGPPGITVAKGAAPNTYRVRWPLPDPPPLVSLLIPTRDRLPLIETAVLSILGKTSYANFEILILDNGSVEPGTLEFFAEIQARDDRVKVLPCDRPFNFSGINNFGAAHARGSILGFINNDIEVIHGDWLGEMVAQASRPEIGCVGAKLYYDDGRIQHAGVILGIGGVAGHSHKYYSRRDTGYFSRLMLAQSLSAVTGACLLVRREVFERAGGFDEENLPVAFNDVDLCLKVRELGYRNLWTPHAELYHLESVSRGAEDTPEKQGRFEKEVRFILKKWGSLLERDPFYNPNLTLEHEDFGLTRLPPRLAESPPAAQ